jgi:hypothetical protein
MNWVTFIGRLGMVILMTGLAVGLVSLIPSVQTGLSSSGDIMSIEPEKYDFLYIYWQLTPQSGVKISIESDRSVNIYLLAVSSRDFQNWTATWAIQQFPNITVDNVWRASINVTVLNAFLESHLGAVLWKSESVTIVSKEFYSSTDANVTGIIANPSPNTVGYQFEIVQLTSIAPKTKVTLLAEILIPVGIVLAIPWVYSTRTRKPQLQ